jgi:hypothetical protein
MIAIDFPERNHVYGKPESMTDEECYDLPVWRGPASIEASGNTVPVIISKWQLSKEDIEEILKTGIIWLKITGGLQPPVELSADYPFIFPEENKMNEKG